MIVLMRAPLAMANRAINANSEVGIASGLAATTSSSGPLEDASVSTSTTIEAVKVTSR
jgi:hypothetical protein